MPKYRQTLELAYPVDVGARVLLCELFLRGPQTAAELRSRAERMHQLTAAEIEALLSELAARPAGALVRRLQRQPGQKEARWAQLLTGEPATVSGADAAPLTVALTLPPEVDRRLAALEADVVRLRSELARLRGALGES